MSSTREEKIDEVIRLARAEGGGDAAIIRRLAALVVTLGAGVSSGLVRGYADISPGAKDGEKPPIY